MQNPTKQNIEITIEQQLKYNEDLKQNLSNSVKMITEKLNGLISILSLQEDFDKVAKSVNSPSEIISKNFTFTRIFDLQTLSKLILTIEAKAVFMRQKCEKQAKWNENETQDTDTADKNLNHSRILKMIEKVNPQKEFKHYQFKPLNIVYQLSEILSFREANKSIFRSDSIDHSKIEFFISGKHKKERKIDSENSIKMNITSGFGKDKPILGFMKFLPNISNSKDMQKVTVSKAVGRVVFKNRRKRCLSEANIRRIEFMKRVKSTTEAFPNKGITDQNFIQKIVNYNDEVREAHK